MRRYLLIAAAVVLAAAVLYFVRQRNTVPEVPFTKAVRQEIVSTLSTNGKVEPIQWAEAHAESGGSIDQVFVQKGQTVNEGAALVRLDTRAAESELASAEARVAQVRADLQLLKQGGRSSDLSNIEGSIASARQELTVAQRDVAALERLQAKNAATAEEVRAARDRVDRANIQIKALESRRTTLVAATDVAGAEARLREAEAAVNAARTRIAMATVRAPMAGVIYQFDLRAGGYLNPGDLVAAIGRLDRVRVLVYVDEPDLGRVHVGQPVNITWDAVAGRQWKGVVDKLPTQVAPLGSRQVGEVATIIENPGSRPAARHQRDGGDPFGGRVERGGAADGCDPPRSRPVRCLRPHGR